MFCPQCGAHNDASQSYCRQCGQQLKAVRLAVEGRLDEATEKFKAGFESIGSGLLTFAIFLFIAIVAGIFFDSLTVIANLSLGALFAAPQIIKGLKRLQRVDNLLDSQKQPPRLQPGQSEPAARLPQAPITDPIEPQLPPVSVTEHTTLDLKKPDAPKTR